MVEVTDQTRKQEYERCQMLADAGLIAPITEDFEIYGMTNEGHLYLEGELDAEHQSRPRVK